MTILRQDDANGTILSQQTWRAGSGVTQNECESGRGWLPSGYYTIMAHFHNYGGSKIQGRVWQLSDKRCAGGAGTLRTELFIHSEETASTGQACGPAGTDYPFCWEGTNDYYSAGCIKLGRARPYPSDLAQANNDWDAWQGWHGYFTPYDRLYVLVY